MAQINDSLTKTIFDEALKLKPSLANFLIPDEDTGLVDSRVLADQIVRNFPWPIGVEIRRLFSAPMRQPDRGRLDQIFRTIERTTQYLSFILVVELREYLSNNSLSLETKFVDQFRQRFLVLTLGNFTWMVRTIGSLLQQKQHKFFMPEFEALLTPTFYDSLDFWVPERNEIGHYQINLTQDEIEKRCVEYQERLSNLLISLCFLINYKLVSVKEIKVLKSRAQAATFRHQIDLLNSSDAEFMSKDEISPDYSDSQAVLIMRNTRLTKEFLNLSPLVIDTRNEVIDTKEKLNMKKDIFLYTKYREGKLMYVGTEASEKCDLSSLSNYAALVQDFENLVESICHK